MKRLCTNCKGENEYIISETSSSYVYCEDCGNMKEIALKQDMFDSILKSMDTYFKHTKVKSIYDLKVIVKFKDGFLVEEINGNILKKCNFLIIQVPCQILLGFSLVFHVKILYVLSFYQAPPSCKK